MDTIFHSEILVWVIWLGCSFCSPPSGEKFLTSPAPIGPGLAPPAISGRSDATVSISSDRVYDRRSCVGCAGLFVSWYSPRLHRPLGPIAKMSEKRVLKKGLYRKGVNISLNLVRVQEKPPACRGRDHPQLTPFSGGEMFCNEPLPGPPACFPGQCNGGGVHAGGLTF